MSLLGERIRSRRKELGLTQSQLGGTDLTKGFISLVEKGRAQPSINTLLLLARRLQKPAAFFLEEGSALGQKVLDVTLRSAWVLLRQGDFTRAAETFTEGQAIAQHRHDQAAQAECYIGLGSALAGLRQFDLAVENVLRGKALAEAANAPEHFARVHHVLGLIEYYRRNLPAAREQFLAGHRLLGTLGHPDVSLAGGILFNLGNTYQEIGDAGEASRWYREALAVLEPTQDLHRIGLVHVQLGAANRDSGNHDAALAHLSRAEHICELLEDARLLALARNSLGIMLREQGRIEEAITQLESSLRIKERLGDDPGRARTLTELARTLIMQRAFPEAEKALAEADRLARLIEDATEAARIQAARARLHRDRGNYADAVSGYQEAIASFEAQGMRTDLAHACQELGEMLMEHQRPSEAAPYLARALEELRTETVSERTGSH